MVSTVVLPYDALTAPVVVEGGRWSFRGQRFASIVLPKGTFATTGGDIDGSLSFSFALVHALCQDARALRDSASAV